MIEICNRCLDRVFQAKAVVIGKLWASSNYIRVEKLQVAREAAFRGFCLSFKRLNGGDRLSKPLYSSYQTYSFRQLPPHTYHTNFCQFFPHISP